MFHAWPQSAISSWKPCNSGAGLNNRCSFVPCKVFRFYILFLLGFMSGLASGQGSRFMCLCRNWCPRLEVQAMKSGTVRKRIFGSVCQGMQPMPRRLYLASTCCSTYWMQRRKASTGASLQHGQLGLTWLDHRLCQIACLYAPEHSALFSS